MLDVPPDRLTLCAPAVRVTVASPGGSEKLTGRPLKADVRFAALTALPAESVSSEAVRVAVPLGPITCDGLAVAVSTKRGTAVIPVPEVVSQPVVFGPVLHPHQFSVRFAVPLPLLVSTPPVPVLPTNRS